MQDTPKVTSETTPQSMYVEYYTHSFLNRSNIKESILTNIINIMEEIYAVGTFVNMVFIQA